MACESHDIIFRITPYFDIRDAGSFLLFSKLIDENESDSFTLMIYMYTCSVRCIGLIALRKILCSRRPCSTQSAGLPLAPFSPAGAASSVSITGGIVAEHHTRESVPLFVRSKEKRDVRPDSGEFCIFDGPVVFSDAKYTKLDGSMQFREKNI